MPRELSRRRLLGVIAALGSSTVLAACGGGSQTLPTPASETKAEAKKEGAAAPAAPKTEATPRPTATPSVMAVARKEGTTELKVWFHWSAATGDRAQELINKYNTTKGVEDKIHMTIETVPGAEYRQKMTAVRLAGTAPDVYHTSLPIKELIKNEVVAELPTEEAGYVRQNYVKGSVDRMTYEGKVWGYPTEHQAPGFIYRKSYFQEAGVQPPKTTQEALEAARKATKTEGGKKTRYGFTQWYDNYPATSHLPALIARFGGQMFYFEGDKPVRIDVASPQAIEAVGWWRAMVEAGATQVGEMPFVDAWQNGLAASGEIEPWFPLINLRDAGKPDIFNDVGVTIAPPKDGVQPIVFAGGWELVGDRSSKQPDLRWKFMRWMMHKPEMPFSRFIVETVGSLPAPIDYPAEIPGWTKEMLQGYAKDTTAIAQAHPAVKVTGGGEIDAVLRTAIQAVMLQQQTVEQALKDADPKVNDILKRTDA